MDVKKIMILAAFWSTSALADGFSASIGGDYSTGKYGTSDSTDVFYMPLVASYSKGPMTFKLNVPFISVTGPGDFVPGGLGGSGGGSTVVTTTNNCRSINSGKGSSGGSGNGQKICDVVTTTVPSTPTTTTGTSTRKTESGLGDISASAIYNVVDNADWVVDLTGKIKFATGSESKGLSNGEMDYALQANVDKYFGAFNLSLGLGYRWLGEPDGVSYKNVTYGSFGGGYKISDAASMGVSYDWATSAVSDGSRPQEVSIFGSYRFNDQYKLSAVLYGGLTDASPDVGGGLTLNYYF